MYKRGEGRVSKREEEIRQRFVNEKLVKRGRERERETGERLSRPSAASWNRYRDRARTRKGERERSGRPDDEEVEAEGDRPNVAKEGQRGRTGARGDETRTKRGRRKSVAARSRERYGGREREMTTGRVCARATGSTRCTRACVRGECGERTGGSLSTGAKYSLV